MNLMICMRGEPEQLAFLSEIAALGAGIELGSYGLVGIQSERNWEKRFSLHKAVRGQFPGAIAVHGPIIGMEYTHPDHLIRNAIIHRLDMIFDVAVRLAASRVILHSGYKAEFDFFNLREDWLDKSVIFWQHEILRWTKAGIVIALENDIDKSPDLLVRLANQVDSPFLGLCMDIGHQHVFSDLDAVEWVRRMKDRLFHIHLHDKDGTGDSHWSLGRGTIDFESFYAAIEGHVPEVTLSLETDDKMEVKMSSLCHLTARFASK